MPIITVQFIEDVVATPEQKRELVVRLTDKFVEILGDVVRPFVYCIIQETPQQEWGIAGVPMPDLVYLTSEQHAEVIERSNSLMRAAIAQMQVGAPAPQSAANGAAPDADDPRVIRNRAVVHDFYQAMNHRNFDQLSALLDPNFVHHGGTSGDLVGAQALIASLDPLLESMPDLRLTEDYVVAQGSSVAVRGRSIGTYLRSYMGAKPTGEKIVSSSISIYRLNEQGKIVERWQDFDQLNMLQQLGVIPSNGS